MGKHEITEANPFPRSEAIVQAARAIISSTDKELRFLILRAGFIKFQKYARRAFDNDTNLRFTSGELRRIWDAIDWWCHGCPSSRLDYTYTGKKNHINEARWYWPTYERVYAQMRTRETWRASELRDQAQMLRDGYIVITENANGRRMVH